MKALLICCALCATCCSPAYAQDADALLAQSKLAAGGDAWNAVRSLSITSEGVHGGALWVEEQHFDVQRVRSLTTYRAGTFDEPGRKENAEGYDGKIAWEQDPYGYSNVVTDTTSLRKDFTEAYIGCRAYWFPERIPAKRQYVGHKREGNTDFDVIQITPEGGEPFHLWMDSTTHLINRVAEGPAGVFTTRCSAK